MAKHIVTLDDHEARRLAMTGTLLIVRPVVPQPPNIAGLYYMEWTPGVWRGYLQMAMSEPASVPEIANPLGAPGDVLVCKEAWLEMPDPDPDFAPATERKYRATDNVDAELYGGWRPASTMPRWAVRFRPIVKDAGVMRVKDLGGRQAIDAGMQVPAHMPQDGADYDWACREFAAHWNRRFRKYPWENNPWCWTARVKMENA